MNRSAKHVSLALAASLFAFPGAASAAPMALAIQADTVLSGPCVQMSQFKIGDRIVFRARVFDTATGDALDTAGLTSVVVELADGTQLPAHFGPHPPSQTVVNFWSIAWTVPAGFPTGTLGYKVVATNAAGETTTFSPLEVPPSLLTIVAAQ